MPQEPGTTRVGVGSTRGNRRERGGSLGCVPRERGHRDLPDHPGIDDVGARRYLGGPRHAERVGHRPAHRRDAERSGRRRRDPRGAADRGPCDDVHRVARTAPHAPRDVQDRRRAHSHRDPRRRTNRRDARALDLRRPLRRDGRAPDRLGAAVLVVRAGGPGLRSRRTCGDSSDACPVPPLLRRLSYLARAQHDRPARAPRPHVHARRALVHEHRDRRFIRPRR